MNKKLLGYWIATALTAFVYLTGGAVDVARPPFLLEEIAHLGFPSYFMVILGTWKILGGIAVLLPRTPILKEWAYAGMTINLTGATAAHAVVGDPPGETAFPLILLGIVAASWALRPADRVVRPSAT
jgi:uncharacterized membrane protein YphA (DoxX/SURF4 family)